MYNVIKAMLVFFVSVGTIVKAQQRVVLNNNSYLVIDNGAYLVIDNPATNALATVGTGGNIKSENELDRIKWNIAATTGIYTIPWTTNTGVKIPLSINKTTTGAGAGNFLLSTWETTDMNSPWPSAVSNMWSSVLPATDGSLEVIDRFWHINALSYTTKPAVTLSFGYNDAANEMLGTNTITEANLQAQRFNTSSSNWEATKLFGTVNIATNTVSGAAVAPADFFENWVLVDNASPLPVTLTHFKAECNNENILIKWATQTEINNDYFIVERSNDGFTFFEIAQVNGAGNSNVVNTYYLTDQTTSSQIIYYRLKQVDFDGTTTYHDMIAAKCAVTEFEVYQLHFNEQSLNFNVNTVLDEKVEIKLFDLRGRLVSENTNWLQKGNNTMALPTLQLQKGIYLLTINGEVNNYSTKVLKIK